MTPDPGSTAGGGAAPTPARAPASSATVQRQFDRRAARFAPAAAVVREAGVRLFERLSYIRHDARTVLDLGCGQGAQRAALQRRFPEATWIGVDLSPAMLERDRGAGRPGPHWLPDALRPRGRALRVCAEAARLPLADASVDCVYSNLMLNWHPAPHRVFPEIARVLREGGLLLFTSLGPDTLRELREACLTSLSHAAPMPFVDMHDLGDMMVAAGFSSPVTDAETLRLTYATPQHLLSEVRALGGNPRDDRHPALPSGRQARALLAALQAQRGADGRIALTFEINYGLGWRAPERAPVSDTTSIPLESLRRQLRRG
jgi:malonyl-CoA O-methyltransferase